MLTLEQKKQLEEKLLAERAHVEAQIRSASTEPDFGEQSGAAFDTDAAEDETEEILNQEGEEYLFKKELVRIDKALSKIHEENYGICESCKGEISFDVLEIDPESQLCKSCKQKEM
jgi:RNA polymerase-binding transcription factor DksA